jgi:hypothetical protein
MLEELYDNFRKFSKLEVLHFRKFEEQRKVPKENEASRPTKYSRGKANTMSFDNATKQIHSIDSDGCGPTENWEKNFEPLHLENRNIAFTTRKKVSSPERGLHRLGTRLWARLRWIAILHLSRKRYIP